jgi:hypothetical protein
MATDSFELGAFLFPSLGETAGTTNVGLTQTGSLNPVGCFSTDQLEDELLDAAIQATNENSNTTTAALGQIDAYFAEDGDESEKQHRQSLLGLLRLLRPNLAELLGEPSSLP